MESAKEPTQVKRLKVKTVSKETPVESSPKGEVKKVQEKKVKAEKVEKVAKVAKSSTPAPAVSGEAVSGEKKSSSSKTTTANIDVIVGVLIDQFKLDEKAVRAALSTHLPSTSAYKKGKKKDKDAPKKYLSSYMYFTMDVRSDIKGSDNAKLPFADVTKELGRRWKIITPEQKLKYTKLSEEDAKRYHTEMDAYRLLKGIVLKTKVSKADDPTLILNPESKKYVNRSSAIGKKLVGTPVAA